MSADYAALAARASYAAAGHGEGGLLNLAPISGREAPNVIDLAERQAVRARAAGEKAVAITDTPCGPQDIAG